MKTLRSILSSLPAGGGLGWGFLLLLLPLGLSAQTITKDNALDYLHGTFDITSGGGDETDIKQYFRVEFLNDVFGHRVTVYGRNNETGKNIAEEYNFRSIRGFGKSYYKDGYIYCYSLDAKRDTVPKSIQYRYLKEDGYTFSYLPNRAFKLTRTSAAPAAASEPVLAQKVSKNPQQQAAQPAQEQKGKAPFTLPSVPNVVPAKLTKAKETFTVGGATFNLIRVDGGTFQMGYPGALERNGYDEERPQHPVTLSTYYMMETEVTQELFAAVMGIAKYEELYNRHEDLRDRRMNARFPVDVITWQLACDFCTKLSQLTGHKFRLPTEAEWEYAAKGGQKSRGYLYSGSNNPDDVAWYRRNSGGYEHAVAQKRPNELGLYDMSGNADEWCLDPDGSYTTEAQTNPQQPAIAWHNGKHQVRGGSAHSEMMDAPLWEIRTTYRHQDKDFDIAIVGHGFRAALPAPDATPTPTPATGNTTVSGRKVDSSSQTTPSTQTTPKTGNTTISTGTGHRVGTTQQPGNTTVSGRKVESSSQSTQTTPSTQPSSNVPKTTAEALAILTDPAYSWMVDDTEHCWRYGSKYSLFASCKPLYYTLKPSEGSVEVRGRAGAASVAGNVRAGHVYTADVASKITFADATSGNFTLGNTGYAMGFRKLTKDGAEFFLNFHGKWVKARRVPRSELPVDRR